MSSNTSIFVGVVEYKYSEAKTITTNITNIFFLLFNAICAIFSIDFSNGNFLFSFIFDGQNALFFKLDIIAIKNVFAIIIAIIAPIALVNPASLNIGILDIYNINMTKPLLYRM